MEHIDTTKAGVYMILNMVNQARYVGSAARCLNNRFAEHRYSLRRNIHRTPHLQNAWNKYGEKAFTFVPLQNCAPNESLKMEQQWFDQFREAGYKLYNSRIYVESQLGMKHTEEAKAKIAASNRGKIKTYSPEAIQSRAAAMKGNQYGKKNARPFEIVSPSGEVVRGDNLLEFCRHIGLTDVQATALYKVVRGEVKSYKGYTAPQARAAYLVEHPLTYPANLSKNCEECGKPFRIKQSAATRRHFCSKTCRAAHDKRIYAGSGNPNYRHGGRVEGVKRVRHRR
jgi:hypothetical protein